MSDLSTFMGEDANITNEELLGLTNEIGSLKEGLKTAVNALEKSKYVDWEFFNVNELISNLETLYK